MAVSPLQLIWELVRAVPREAIGLTGFALAFAAVVAAGVALGVGAVAPSPAVLIAGYGIPGAAAFALYLTLMRRD
jgi:hypothetical protein